MTFGVRLEGLAGEQSRAEDEAATRGYQAPAKVNSPIKEKPVSAQAAAPVGRSE